MNQAKRYDWHEPQRQAFAGLLIMVYKTVISIIKTLWPLLLVIIFRTGQKNDQDGFPWILSAISVLALVHSVLNFFWFRFYIADDDLIIRKGFITRKKITIPLERIQAVHIEQNLLHQLLDVVKVRIDTAGSEKTEAVIDAIARRKADQFRAFLLQEKKQLAPDEQAAMPVPEKPVLRLSVSELLKLGITANHFQAFFIVLAFMLSVFQNLREAFGDDIITTVEATVAARRLLSSIPLLIAMVMVVSIFVSLAMVLLRYYNLYLAETPGGYKLSMGLLNNRQFLVPFPRIQFISWEANWLRRKIGLYTVEFHQVAGNKVNEKQLVRVPVTRQEYISVLLHHYHEALYNAAHSVHGIHASYIVRRVLIAGILPVIPLVSLLLAWELYPWMLLPALWVLGTWFNAWGYRNNFRLYVAPDAFQVISGIWGRKVRVVKWYKIQQVLLQQSLYQQRKGLATISLVTAGGAITIPFIPLELAQQIQNYALYEVERADRAWL
jgi:Predicted membrane protein